MYFLFCLLLLLLPQTGLTPLMEGSSGGFHEVKKVLINKVHVQYFTHIMWYSPVHIYCSFPFLHIVCLSSLPCPSHYRVLMSMLPQYPVLETQLSPLLLARVTIGLSSYHYTMLQMLTSRTRKGTHLFALHQPAANPTCSSGFLLGFLKGVVHLVCS